MKRLRPSVHQLTPPPRIQLSDEEARAIARRMAQGPVPSVQRDLIELWGPEKQKPKPKQRRKRHA